MPRTGVDLTAAPGHFVFSYAECGICVAFYIVNSSLDSRTPPLSLLPTFKKFLRRRPAAMTGPSKGLSETRF